VRISNATATMAMATSTGSNPLSPLLSFCHQPRRYSPSDWARISNGTSAAVIPAAVRSTSMGTSAAVSPEVPDLRSPWIRATASGLLSGGGSSRLFQRSPPRAPGGHVLHHALAVKAGGRSLGHHPPEVKHRKPVRHLEAVVEVVGDHHHRQASVA